MSKIKSTNYGSHVLLSIAMVGAISACTDNRESEIERATDTAIKQNNVLLNIALPAEHTMDSEVAVIISAGWDVLNTALKTDLNAEKKAQAYADFGLIAFGNGLSLPAETAFQNATTLAPDNAKWAYFLALIHEYNGKLESAADGFNTVLSLRQNDLPALIRLAGVRFEQSNMHESKTLYERVLELDKTNAAALFGLGKVESALNNHEAAVKHFSKTLELQPNANRVFYFLGIAQRNLGDSEQASKNLAKYGTNEPSFADPLFDEISNGESRIDGLWAHMNAGSQALVEGNNDKAVKEFELATIDLPDDARSWQSLGMALVRTGEIDRAKKAYQTALNLNQDDAVIYRELAKLFNASGDIKTAKDHLLRAIQIDPEMIDAHISLAKLHSTTGQHSDALKHYDTALQLDPQSTDTVINKAKALVALGNIDEAVVTIGEMIRVIPDDADLRATYSLVLLDAGQLDNARSEAARATQLANDNDTRSNAHYALGQILTRQRKPNEAISEFGAALKNDPENKAAALELARSFIRVKDLNQALATYDVYLSKWPNSDASRIEAGRVALMLGDTKKTKTLLEGGLHNASSSARLLGSLARLLVLATDEQVRNPEQALKYAQQAIAVSDAFVHQETLALCYAATGDFDNAVKLQSQIISSEVNAADVNTERVRQRLQQNLRYFQNKKIGRLPFDPG